MVSSNLNFRLRLAKARKSVDNGSELVVVLFHKI